MEPSSTLIVKHLARCRIQQKQVVGKEEAERLLAEEEGLLDALLGRDRTDMYGPDQQARRESYELGLHEGRVLIGLQRRSNSRQSLISTPKHWWRSLKQTLQAEEEALLYALLEMDRTEMYGSDQQARRESSEPGFHEGRALAGLQPRSNSSQALIRTPKYWWRALKQWWGAGIPLSR